MKQGREIPELSEQEGARWQAVGSTIRALGDRIATGQVTGEDVAATFAQLGQIPLDHESILDSLHIPDDAGDFREALVAMLLRIPDGRGRWISCDRGWYPLITELDAQLAALCPKYELYQVKEKYGTLRYYAAPSGHHQGRDDEFHSLVDEAERRSATSCENCGSEGRLCVRHHWYRTLCDACCEAAAADGRGRYEPVEPGLDERS